MALLKINGVDIPTPRGYKVNKYDVTKSERNAKGNMFQELINKKRKLELEWAYLDAQVLANMLQMIDNNQNFTVEYLDPYTNTTKSSIFYCGDVNVTAMDYVNGNIRWKDIKFNLVEC